MSHTPTIDSGMVPAPGGSYENPSTAAPSQASQNGNTYPQGLNQSATPIHQSGVKTTSSQSPIHGAGNPTPLHPTSNHPQKGDPNPTPLHPRHQSHPMRSYVEPESDSAPPLPPRDNHGHALHPLDHQEQQTPVPGQTTTKVGGLDGKYHDIPQTSPEALGTGTETGTGASHIPHVRRGDYASGGTHSDIPHTATHPGPPKTADQLDHPSTGILHPASTTSNTTHPLTTNTNTPHPAPNEPADPRTTSEKLKESASGVKGLVAAVHGTGEKLRGGFNKEVDRAFGDKVGEEKNARIAGIGASEIQEGRFNHGPSRTE